MAKFKQYKIGLEDKMTIDILSLLPKDHLAFFVEQQVSLLDTQVIESKYSKLGQGAYHPKMMLSVLFLGYMLGIRSGRKLAQACRENIGFIYLSKGYYPQKTSINEFRRIHVDHFDNLFKQVLGLFDLEEASKKGLDASTSIFDGSKIRANASKYQTRDKSTYERWLNYLSEDIAEIREELAKQKTEELEKELSKKEGFKKK